MCKLCHYLIAFKCKPKILKNKNQRLCLKVVLKQVVWGPMFVLMGDCHNLMQFCTQLIIFKGYFYDISVNFFDI